MLYTAIRLNPSASAAPHTGRYLATLAVFVGGFLATTERAFAEDLDQVTPELLIVARETKIYVPEGDKMVARATLPPKTLLKTNLTLLNPRIPISKNFCSVIRLGSSPEVEGWIDCRDAFNLYSGSERRYPFVYTASRPPDWDLPRIPSLIKREPEYIQKAWIDVESAFALMKTMMKERKLAQEMPEPYFARGLLWSRVGNFEAALSDYLRAGHLVKTSRQDMIAYSRYFVVLVDALQKRTQIPKPFVSTRNGYSFTEGKENYFRRDFDRALIYFDDAVQVEPTNPLHWYYRALTYKRMGRDELALRDAIIGADLERTFQTQRTYGGGAPSGIDLGLERIQGSLRMWLSNIRDGDPVLRRSALSRVRRE